MDEIPGEDIIKICFSSMALGIIGSLIALEKIHSMLIFILVLFGVYIFLLLLFCVLFLIFKGDTSRELQNTILYAKDEKTCYNAILSVKTCCSTERFPDAFSQHISTPFHIAFHNLQVYKGEKKDTFTCKEIWQGRYRYKINPGCRSGQFYVTKIEPTSEEPTIIIDEDKTTLYLPQKQYQKIITSKD